MNHKELIAYEETRLGQLLLRRGLIQPEQIARALSLQGETNQLLGEVLVKQGWLSKGCLVHTLHLQRRLRAALGVVTLVGVPMVSADDAMQARAEPIAARTAASGMLALDEAELGEVSAGNLGGSAPEAGAPGLRVSAASSEMPEEEVSWWSWKQIHALEGIERRDLENTFLVSRRGLNGVGNPQIRVSYR